ncbi:prolyl oligopeptidase family serine peptidase [Actinoallomurus spadix]|uniref:Peptidase S9 prolyl oligopeptidase catalytic domain-containing protein n=1 Tax=Actinoallomurus spadix TaxID=79912 RepID=A0ABN0VYP9_9ACTN|nr:prolyl oligopeptidase family serine peptidase [Actinoallomurus spadix]MCO5988042.1 prolyl oligopeptidase family serine peptidase [Actinoallomurus spadix]
MIGERLREQVLDLLHACAERTTESHRGGYGTSLIQAPYPPLLRTGPLPAGLRPGRLCLHLPDGTHWAPDRLHESLGRPVQHPAESAVFAGVAIESGEPRCWIADAADRSVTFTGPAPALLPGDDALIAWAGAGLAVPMDPPPEPYDAAPQVFASPPGARLRVTAGCPAPDRRPAGFVILNPSDGGVAATSLSARPYRRVRGSATGHVAACAPATGGRGEIVAVGRPGGIDECLLPVEDGPLHDFCWLPAARPSSRRTPAVASGVKPSPQATPDAAISEEHASERVPAVTRPAGAHLVMVVGRPDGFDLMTCTVSGDTVGPPRLLRRHPGRYLHAHHQDALVILALDADGSYAVLVVDPGAPRPVRSLSLGLRPPVLLRIAAVAAVPLTAMAEAAGATAGLRFATVDADRRVVLWEVPAEGTAARRLSDLSLPAGEELITVSGWAPGEVRPVCDRSRPRAPLPAHPGGPAPLRGTVPAAAAEFSLYLPADRDPAAVLVWLSQANQALPGAAAASAPPSETVAGSASPSETVAGSAVPCGAAAASTGPDPHWLTLAGFGVLDVRITPAWAPTVPDEEIRPRLVRQIRDAVLGSAAHRHVGTAGLVVGGVSFGATLALLAVTDCDLFSAAIVQNGAYSRQLTLLGFQDEARTLWEAPRVYADFDAIVNARRIRRPVLIIHGEADRNPATPVLQATLLYQALIANGTRARLVVLPGEGHVLRSRNGIAASLAEKAAWLAAVGGPGGTAAEAPSAAGAKAMNSPPTSP